MKQAADPSASPSTEGRIGLIAGRGDLPALLIQAARDQGRNMFVLAVKGDTSPEPLDEIPHQWIEMADIALTLDIFREQKVSHILMAGGLSRPPLKAFKPSALTTRLLGRIGKAFFGGDDTLFKAIVQIFEEEGFTILGADTLLTDLLTPAGMLTRVKPSKEAQEDIERGIPLIKKIGELDIGQALILRNGQVLGVEALEGTDELIRRCNMLSQNDTYKGTLIKARKPGQENRVDLPSVGPETISNLHEAGFAGLALEAQGSLMIRKEETIRLANELGLFILGFHAAQAA